MKNIKELLEVLNLRYPFELAEKWDNIGLLVGSMTDEINKIFVSLDITTSMLKDIPNGSTLITHHPLIFNPLKKVDFDSYHGKIIKELIKKDISYIVLHTNYDKAFLNKYFIENVLKKELYSGEDFIDYCIVPDQSLGEFRQFLASSMNCLTRELNIVGNKEEIIRMVAVCTGSGSSSFKTAKEKGANVLITGDITYHTAMEAKELGMNLIDITHYHSEKWFGDDLVIDMNATKLDSGNPFEE